MDDIAMVMEETYRILEAETSPNVVPSADVEASSTSISLKRMVEQRLERGRQLREKEEEIRRVNQLKYEQLHPLQVEQEQQRRKNFQENIQRLIQLVQ